MVKIGDKFERLTVVENPFRDGKYYKCLCQCVCGNTKIIRTDVLENGKSKSCGCLKKEVDKIKGKKLGLSQRVNFGCFVCGSDKHYAKGLCRNCYEKRRRGTL